MRRSHELLAGIELAIPQGKSIIENQHKANVVVTNNSNAGIEGDANQSAAMTSSINISKVATASSGLQLLSTTFDRGLGGGGLDDRDEALHLQAVEAVEALALV